MSATGFGGAIEWWKMQNLLNQEDLEGRSPLHEPHHGRQGGHKNHRYTAGAKALDDKGVPILPVAGGAILHLGEPPK